MGKNYTIAFKVVKVFRSVAVAMFLMAASNASAQGFTVLGTTGNSPEGIVIDAAGNVYTPNTLDNTVTKITPAGVSSTFATTGTAPVDIAKDALGNLYVVNNTSNTVTKITPAGVSSTFGTTGANPVKVAVDALENVYTINSNNTVTKITPAGVSSTISTMVNTPNGIAIDGSGNVYITNSGNNTVTKITSAGVSSTFGTTGTSPSGIAIDAGGNVYTVNSNSANITKITPAGVSSIFATTSNIPQAIVIAPSGNVFVSIYGFVSSKVTEITQGGVVTTVGTTGKNPSAIAIDAAGYIYTANTYDNTVSKSKNTVLPIAILSFIGTKTNNGNFLQWFVDNAFNFSHFELQSKGKNATDFTLLKSVEYKVGTSTYSYIDGPLEDINYYRLALVDLDGSVQYSNILSIVNYGSSIAGIGAYPNPVVASSNIIINGITNFSSAFITVVNNFGQIVDKKQVTQNAIKIDFSLLPKGIYHLMYTDAAGRKLQTEVVK